MAADRHDADAGLLSAISVEQTWHFDGAAGDVSNARTWAGDFLHQLARIHPPVAVDAHDDALLVVSELAGNTAAFAPGPFTLTLQALMTGTLHIALADTNPTGPTSRPVDHTGRGGLGWHLINTLAEETITVTRSGGKTVHVFLPW
ncbi:ATP-binding protein [Streptomyces sp. G35A]